MKALLFVKINDIFFFVVMDGSLPRSLKHIISNAEYYGPSLFLLGKSLSLDSSNGRHCLVVSNS